MRLLPALLLFGSTACFAAPAVPATQGVQAAQASSEQNTNSTEADSAAALGDPERSAIVFESYDLDVHLRPADAGISVVARVSVKNNSDKPLPRIALQLSSALHWDGVSQTHRGTSQKLAFDQHLIETDADHTGQASESVIALPAPLTPGASSELTLLYSGTIRESANAVSEPEASRSDWDRISPQGTSLRGFGNVLWYPVASPQVFLADGASVLQAGGHQMLRQAASPFRIRISVEYLGEAPRAIFFCGTQEPFADVRDEPDAPIADTPGVATAQFSLRELGFRFPSLFITRDAVLANGSLVAVVSDESSVLDRLTATSTPIAEFLSEWLGKGADRTLTVIDHPGVPYADNSLLVAPITGADARTLTTELVPALAHTRFRSVHSWLDQGVAQFLSLLWIERKEGRPAAVKALEGQSPALALAESMTHPRDGQDGLLTASDPVYFRDKAAAILWQLRGMIGDAPLQRGLQQYVRESQQEADPKGFEKVIEAVSGKDLRWFFDDWVYHDQGLPDLSILSASPRALPSKIAGGSGWLVAVEVRNEGGAAAEVPVTIRSGTLTATERLRIGAHSVASTRVLFQGTPEQVQVNDGSVPELVSSVHLQNLSVP